MQVLVYLSIDLSDRGLIRNGRDRSYKPVNDCCYLVCNVGLWPE